MLVKNKAEKLEKTIPSVLKTIKIRIDTKNTPIPLFNIFVRSTITNDKTSIGINVTKYETNILIIPCAVKELELKIKPAKVEKIITNKRFTKTNNIIETIFAVKNFSLEIGLVSAIFIMF